MRNVSILTFHFVPNYGAALQTYALQVAIGKMGYKCYIADYRSPFIVKGNEPASFSLAPKAFVKYLLMSRYQNRRVKAFRVFEKCNLNLTKPISPNLIELQDYNIGTIVVGSDQVWNPAISGDDRTYLLEGVQNVRRVAYAASLGSSSLPSENELDWLRGIASFDFISVRESSAKPYLEKHLTRSIFHVADPVLLLDPKEWEAKLPTLIAGKKRYVLLYCLKNVNRTMLSFARNRCKSLNAQLVVIHYSPIHVARAHNIRDCSPLEFVAYIQNAAEIVTSSFHGVCFSVLFHKTFYALYDASSNRTEARVKDMLNYCGLEDRFISHVSETTSIPSQKWTLVDRKIEELRKESSNFLLSALKGTN